MLKIYASLVPMIRLRKYFNKKIYLEKIRDIKFFFSKKAPGSHGFIYCDNLVNAFMLKLDMFILIKCEHYPICKKC